MRLIVLPFIIVVLMPAAVSAAPGDQITAPPAGSGQDMDLAARHFDDGKRLYQEKKYALARVEFEAAFALSGEPDMLHNVSLAAEREGALQDAIRYEERYLADKRVSLSQREMDEAQGRLARLRAASAAGTAVLPAPADTRTPVQVRVQQPVGVSRVSDRRRVPRGAIGLMVGGGALLVVGIGCGAGAFVAGEALKTGGPFTVQEVDAMTARGEGLERAGIAFDVLGGSALAAGAIWAIAGR